MRGSGNRLFEPVETFLHHGVFAPDAPLRPLVAQRAHQDNALAVQNLPAESERGLERPSLTPVSLDVIHLHA
jgi:hypothetical protein